MTSRPDQPGRHPFGIFVSYRRDDSAGHAGRLYDKLAERFGRRRVFIDVNTIQPGVDFRTAIDQALSSSSIVLVLIGKRWLDAANANGTRRLDDPADLVRLEIATALRQGLDVIPILVQRASLPAADELPEDIRALKFRHAIEIDDASWDQDAARLIHAIERSSGARPAGQTRRLALPIAIGAAVLTVAIAALLLGSNLGSGTPTPSQTAAASITQPPASTPASALPSGTPISANPSFGTVVYGDALTGRVPGMAASTSPNCEYDVTDGLAITARGAGHLCAESLAPLDPALVSLQDVSIEVDVDFKAFTATSSKFGPGDAAVICRMVGTPSSGDYYIGSISPSGYWDLNRYANGIQDRIDTGSDPDLATPTGGTRHLRLDCTGAPGGRATITLSIDGQVVSSVIDREGLAPGSVALVVTAYEEPAITAGFHDLAVRAP